MATFEDQTIDIRCPNCGIVNSLPVREFEEHTESHLVCVSCKAGVKIENACFQSPLPLMGVKHGNFSAGSPVVFHLHFDESGWHADKVVH